MLEHVSVMTIQRMIIEARAVREFEMEEEEEEEESEGRVPWKILVDTSDLSL